jgi:membrane protein DedA with SNARE-associated domain
METIASWIAHYGYLGLFMLLMLGIVGLPVPDETLLVFCGYLIWKGQLSAVPTFLAAFCGSTCGITISYLLGRNYGHKLIYQYGKYIGLSSERLDRVHRWFSKLGTWLLAAGYFIPGVRHFTALVAGTSELKWISFVVFAYTGAAVWVTTFLSLGYLVGDQWEQTSETFHKYVLGAVAVLGICGLTVWFFRRRNSRS